VFGRGERVEGREEGEKGGVYEGGGGVAVSKGFVLGV
jgi:hypothetical protein